jgi:PAS domain S-box-containing protein
MGHKNSANRSDEEIDYLAAFEHTPVGLAILHDRTIVACNHLFAQIFRSERENLINQSMTVLYSTQEDFEQRGCNVGPLLAKNGRHADDWIMKRMDGELFWCHVSGFTFDRNEPYARVIWSFEDLSLKRQVSPIPASLTPRERDVAALLSEGRTSKEIGKQLGISPRTVDIYRANLLSKYSATNTADLIRNLLVLRE